MTVKTWEVNWDHLDCIPDSMISITVPCTAQCHSHHNLPGTDILL